ncbi:MAG: hypothetical protein M3Q73_02690 [bacterium]|nr:hypothetical protein [bacterium]
MAKIIGLGTVVQMLSGASLFLLNTESHSVLALCSRAGVYLAIIAAVEYVLFVYSSKNNVALFPKIFVTRSLAISCAVIISTVFISLI